MGHTEGGDGDDNCHTAKAGDVPVDVDESKSTASRNTDGTGDACSLDAVEAETIDNVDDVHVKADKNCVASSLSHKSLMLLILMALNVSSVVTEMTTVENEGSYSMFTTD